LEHKSLVVREERRKLSSSLRVLSRMSKREKSNREGEGEALALSLWPDIQAPNGH